MAFRETGDTDPEPGKLSWLDVLVADLADEVDELRCVGESIGSPVMIFICGSVASECEDALYPALGISLDDRADLIFGMFYTGEVGDGDNSCLLTHAMNEISGELACRSTSSIGNTDKRRSQVFEFDNMIEELGRTISGFGWEELKREGRPCSVQDVFEMLHAASRRLDECDGL